MKMFNSSTPRSLDDRFYSLSVCIARAFCCLAFLTLVIVGGKFLADFMMWWFA